MNEYFANVQSSQVEISRRSLRAVRSFTSKFFVVPFKLLPRVFYHGFLLSFIIAGFWLMDSLKDPVLSALVGIEYQPMAKLCSVFVTLIITFMYERATLVLRKVDLFHVVSLVFGLAFMVLAALLSDPKLGLRSKSPKGPHQVIGWSAYFIIEAYGSLMVALFWSFTNSIMNLEEAKGVYGLIISIAQIGAIIGSTIATIKIGIPQLFLVGSVTVFTVSFIVKIYGINFPKKRKGTRRTSGTPTSNKSTYFDFSETETSSFHSIPRNDDKLHLKEHVGELDFDQNRNVPNDEFPENTELTENINHVVAGADNQSSWSEGLSLIVKHRYVMYILGISALYEMVVTILDYQFKILGASAVIKRFPESGGETGYEDHFAILLGHFGQVTNLFSFLVSMFGFSFIVKSVGVKFSLMVFPIILFIGVILTNLMSSLTVLFITVSLIKALIFSFHDPVKELLYQPTSEPIKFKAKAWIDCLGARFAKALGSFISYASFGNATVLRSIGEIPCIFVSILVIVVAYLAGSEFQRLVDAELVVGEDDVRGKSREEKELELFISSKDEYD